MIPEKTLNSKNEIQLYVCSLLLWECMFLWACAVHRHWVPISAAQFWGSVEHSCRLWHQTLGPLGTYHTHLQVQQGGPILWDARPYNRHSALWLSNGKAAGGQAFGVVYRNHWSWQGRKLASGKKCYQKWGTVELGSLASEITRCFPCLACVTFAGRIYLCRIYIDLGISPGFISFCTHPRVGVIGQVLSLGTFHTSAMVSQCLERNCPEQLCSPRTVDEGHSILFPT